MDTDILKKQWAPYENLVAFSTVLRTISRPCEMINQQPRTIIPSIELASDGPVVRNIFIFTDDYICEVRLAQNAEAFDMMLFRTIAYYRIDLGSHEVKLPEKKETKEPSAQPTEEKPPAPIVYQTAKITLYHFGPANISSELFYVGRDRDPWLSSVLRILPVDILKRSKASN